MEISKETRLTIVTASVAAQVLHECLDDVEETSFYRHSLKNATKRMQAELTKTCDPQTNHLWNVSEEGMRAIQDGILEISKVIAEANPARIIAMGHLIKKNPDALNMEEA
jgi:hypothetical protein